MNKTRARLIPVFVLLALFSAIMLASPTIKVAHAGGPLSISFLTVAQPPIFTPGNAGDVIAIEFQEILCVGNGSPGGCTSAGTGVTSITDTQSDVWTSRGSATLNGQNCFGSVSTWNCKNELWTTTIAGKVSTTVTINFAGGGGGSGYVEQVLDLANAVEVPVCVVSGTGGSGTAMTTSSSCVPISGQGSIAGLQIGPNAASPSCAWASNIVPPATGDGESAYSSSFTGSTNFPCTQNASAPWIDLGAVFNGVLVPTIGITIQTSPVNLMNGLVINGTRYSTTVHLVLIAGRPLNITAATKVLGPGAALYSFSSWSDSGARSHVITVPSSNTTYIATFSASGGPGGTCSGTPFHELQQGCWLPAIVNWYSNGSSGLNGGIGLSYFLAIVIGDIDIALFLSTRSGLIAGTVFTVSVAILGFALPGVFPSLAYFTLIVMPAAVIYKAYTLRS